MEPEQQKKVVIPGYSSIEDFTKNGFKILVEATKASNALPTERDWDFYKVHDSFNKIMNCESDNILRLMNNILHTEHVTANIRNRDLEEKMEIVIETNDDILEKVAGGIDEMNGIKKNIPEAIQMQAVSAQLPVNGSWNQLNKATYSVSSSIDTMVNEKSKSLKSIRLLTAKNIVRPQSFFKDKIDNRNIPWVPRITEKPNSIKPLAVFLEESERGEQYSHPYELELERFTPAAVQLQKIIPVNPKPLDETPLHEISTPEQLNELLEELRKHSAFAVDLEHHSYRTFMGITCLMQISTKDADYLIDTLNLRDKLYILNEVFTKPSIVKVFHGADCDVEWLQRDLSLYIVNMFDTHQAAKQLEYAGLSLAYLLNRFCKVVPNKHFQLADWRIRPLPDELKTYARMDTHYLLYIYHMLKIELLKKGNESDNILKSVIRESTQICKKRYLKPLLRDDSHLDFYRKCKRMFDNRQMYALRELYQWRDNIARTEDESTGYVLPNHMLLQISEVLPREMQGILACCNPIPPLVRSNLLELHRIILRAREQSTVKPILKEDNRSRGSTLQFTKINVDSPLHCPHDLSKQPEFRDDLPTLLGKIEKRENKDNEPVVKNNNATKLKKTKSVYSVFNTPENSDDEIENETVLKVRSLASLGPYERYKLVKPFIQAEEDKAEAEELENKSEKQDNEDRIAALHAHFVKVTKEVPQKLPDSTKSESEPPKNVPESTSSETLVSMGGSKKRKRKQLDIEGTDELDCANPVPYSELHTPVPNWRRNKFPKNKKQRRNNSNQSPQNLNRHERSKQSETGFEQTPHQQQFRHSPHNSEQHQRERFHNKPDTPDTRANNESNTLSNRQKKRQEWLKKKAQAKQTQSSPVQFNNQTQKKEFTPFDYSSVNFQQFQGGAGGSNKKQAVKTQFKGKVNEKSKSLKSIRLLTAKNIVRPQSFFKDKIDNRNIPWVPRITEKPNSIKPLAVFLEESERGEQYSHPYELELERFTPAAVQLQKIIPVNPKPLDETPLHEISTPEQLNELLEELRKHSAFAVDLEHHSYRTFMGITCLMQISTKDADYLIDTLNLRDKLYILNEVFTKPSIVKVFHGADCDVEWLQRDLSLYIVNMFDTHQAAKQLEYAGLSLAYLLNRFCKVVPNKHFQLADWRIRPLPDELKTYARMDTHYLLYIYHMLKIELLKKGNESDNILKSVIRESTQICKKRYLKPLLRDDSHLDFYRKCKRMFDNRQMYALRELYQWRDNIARTEDESTGYVLPNHMLLQISEVLPREMQGILACCNPIPPLVRSNLLELHRIILRAREQSTVKPILKEDNRSRGSTLQFTKINVDSPLHCPHDLSKQPEFRDDLPTLLGKIEKRENKDNEPVVKNNNATKLKKTKSVYSVFNTPENSDDEIENETVLKVRSLASLGPYERYKLVKPFIQAEEDKAEAEELENKSEKQDNEDRIAALHAHFVKVTKEVPQKLPDSTKSESEPPKNVPESTSSETLVSMGGSKKRKRKQLDIEGTDELDCANPVPYSELHTPVPNWRRNKFPKNKKQRRNNSNQSPQNLNRHERSKQSETGFEQTPHQQQFRHSPHNSEQHQRERFHNKPDTPDTRANNESNTLSNRQKKRQEWLKKKAQAKQTQSSPVQFNNQTQKKEFTPFDYSSVNFQQFQGGAGGSNKKQAVKTQFKGKNKNKKFNKNSNNKTMTYGRSGH